MLRRIQEKQHLIEVQSVLFKKFIGFHVKCPAEVFRSEVKIDNVRFERKSLLQFRSTCLEYMFIYFNQCHECEQLSLDDFRARYLLTDKWKERERETERERESERESLFMLRWKVTEF